MSRRARSAPTISDVARHAGVSPMTVSRVINGEVNVRASTRETVNVAIAALQYAPNPAARTLAGATRNRIGLLYSNPSAAYLSEFLIGTLDQASRNGVQMIVEKCEPEVDEVAAARRLIEGGIDGVILSAPLCDSAALMDLLAAAEVPTVLVGSGRPSDEHHAVSIDDRAAAEAMTRHILDLGHRRIGFIIGNPGQSVSDCRLDGYRAALADAGIVFDGAMVAQGLFTYRSGLEAAERLLSQDAPPTAIFASNDDMAAAVTAVAHRRGLRVPGDLTVCGYDDTTLATAVWPELTTIHQPIADMSRAAVELLVQAMRRPRDDPAPPEHQRLDFTLVRRQSDGPPLDVG